MMEGGGGRGAGANFWGGSDAGGGSRKDPGAEHAKGGGEGGEDRKRQEGEGRGFEGGREGEGGTTTNGRGKRRGKTKGQRGRDMAKTIGKMADLASEIFPGVCGDPDSLKRVVEEAFKTADEDYGEQKAAEWGQGFFWPVGIHLRDERLAAAHGYNIEAMSRAHQEARRHERLSHERVERWVPSDDPDRQRMFSLADGMNVLTADDFEPVGRPPKMRNLYKRVKNAVNRVLAEIWSEGLAFIVTKQTAALMAERNGPLQYNTVSWAPKKGKPQGRYICDSSDASAGAALNSDAAAQKLESFYGKIAHPTLEELINMINDYVDELRATMGDDFQWDELRLWKGDLRKAFTLLDISPDCVKFFACELTDNLVLLYNSGNFGWTGTPYCFDVPTRVISRQVKRSIQGRSRMFVDDAMGVVLARWLAHDQNVMRTVSEGLLGPHAMAEDKWEAGVRLTWIGWDIDLVRRRVTISRRNFMKTLYGFFIVDLDHAQVREIERLASWASRYSTILRVMEPFNGALYAELAGMRNRHSFKPLRGMGARVAVWMWRVMLCLLRLNENTFARTFDSFRPRAAEVLVEFDASLEGVGLVITDLRTGETVGLDGVVFPYSLHGQSRFQNSSEFVAVTLGCVCLVRAGYRGVGITLRGDNMSSLSWGSSEHFSSRLCMSAVLFFMLLTTTFDLRVVSAQHVPGDENVVCDLLSRGYRPGDMGVPIGLGLDLRADIIQETMILCDPSIEIQSEEAFLRLWVGVRGVLQRLERTNPPQG